MIKKNILLFIAFALTSGIFFTIYSVGQQIYRMSANDPQISMARDAGELLNQGKMPAELMNKEKIDLGKSLSPFLLVYGNSGDPISSSALLDGQIPKLPAGVFDYTRQHGEDRISWQPKEDVRQALVVVKYNNGFVAAGRSLSETELREGQLLLRVALAYFSSLLLLGVSAWLVNTKALAKN